MEEHEVWQELLSACVDGELTPEEESALEEHLKSCKKCRSALALLQGMSNALHEEEEAPAALARGSRYLFDREQANRRSGWKRWRFTAIAAVVCLALLGAGTLGPKLFGGNMSKKAEAAVSMETADIPADVPTEEPPQAPKTSAPAVNAAASGVVKQVSTDSNSAAPEEAGEPAPQAAAAPAAENAAEDTAVTSLPGAVQSIRGEEEAEGGSDAFLESSLYYTEGLPGYAIYRELENADAWYSVCFVYGSVPDTIREDRECVLLEAPEGQERWMVPLSVCLNEGLQEQFNEIYYGDLLSQHGLVIGITDMEEEKWLP